MRRHNDKNHQAGPDPIITLSPESAVPDQPGASDPPAAPGNVEPVQPVAETDALKAEIEKLRQQLQEKDKEISELKDKFLRTLADGENARRRIRQQSEESVRLQRENLLRDLLPIIDNLERAVDAARGGGNGKSIVQGVEMTLASMLEFLKSQGVTPEASVGQPFDPAHHEAVDHVSSDIHPANTVVQEFHRGYKIGDRVLRPARVVVAKSAESPETGRTNGENQGGD
jgi:molecular chaperone GrpE